MESSTIQNQLVQTWEISNRVTEFFFESLPDEVWDLKIPGAQRRTVRMIAGHIHNARCMWLKMLGKNFSGRVPASVDRRRVNRRELLKALQVSNAAIIQLLQSAYGMGGEMRLKIPWANISGDIFHFAGYMIAHEAHHRGQIILVARALGHRLSPKLSNGIWQWKQRQREVSARKRRRINNH